MKNILFIFMGTLLAFIVFFIIYSDLNLDALPTKTKLKYIQKNNTQEKNATEMTQQRSREHTTIKIKNNVKDLDITTDIPQKSIEDIDKYTDNENIYKEEMQQETIKTVKPKSPKPFTLSLTNAHKVKIKIKAREKSGIVNAKVSITHEMLTYMQAKKRGVEVNYVTRIQGIVGERVVYDVSTSQFLSKNPLMKFSFQGHKGEVLKIIYTELKGGMFYDSKKIK